VKYRKKPVVVEAFQMTEARRKDNSEWPKWLHIAWNTPRYDYGALWPLNYPVSDGADTLLLNTPEGVMNVRFGDWIIRGVAGELYPCKPDIFAATYEPVEDVK
jgi:hypothetical protein